mmetsp:Transcript_6902/g.3852  ORF Transcript_6902/g.3852 Transcript_6902/m.3852 type:complete len:359 (+) Transcript_6902:27-1103(+)
MEKTSVNIPAKFSKYFREVLLTLTAVFCFTIFIMLVAGVPPLKAYYHILKGSLGSWAKFANVLTTWVPLTLCSIGLLYTFRVGLWNIGVEGQIMMGAIFTTAILRIGIDSEMPLMVIVFSFAGGIAGGALFALLAGFLKIKGGVNEIFAGLGLNFVAQALILWLIFGPWRRPGIASMSGTEIFPHSLWLPSFSIIRFSPAGLILTIVSIIITALMLSQTRIGLKFKAVGNNSNAAFLFGIKPDRYMLLAIILGGGFAGLAGSIQVTGVYHRLLPSISCNYGYLALMVVMLSNDKVWIAPLIAFFFACINVGSIQLPIVLQLDSSLSGVIQGAFVLTTLAMHSWKTHKENKQLSYYTKS